MTLSSNREPVVYRIDVCPKCRGRKIDSRSACSRCLGFDAANEVIDVVPVSERDRYREALATIEHLEPMEEMQEAQAIAREALDG
jgi:hypothetical protein